MADEMDVEGIINQREDYRKYIVEKYAEQTATNYFNSKVDFFQAVVDYATKYNIEKLASLARGHLAISKHDEKVYHNDLDGLNADYGSFEMLANRLFERVNENLYLVPRDVVFYCEAYRKIEKQLVHVEDCYSDLIDLHYYAYSDITLLPRFIEEQERNSSSSNGISK